MRINSMHDVMYEEGGSNGKTNKINSEAHVWWFRLKPSDQIIP